VTGYYRCPVKGTVSRLRKRESRSIRRERKARGRKGARGEKIVVLIASRKGLLPWPSTISKITSPGLRWEKSWGGRDKKNRAPSMTENKRGALRGGLEHQVKEDVASLAREGDVCRLGTRSGSLSRKVSKSSQLK